MALEVQSQVVVGTLRPLCLPCGRRLPRVLTRPPLHVCTCVFYTTPLRLGQGPESLGLAVQHMNLGGQASSHTSEAPKV